MKKLFSIITIVTVAATGWNYNQSQNEVELSSLALANVEALANNESSSTLQCDGLLGRCSFKCSKCGTDWWAIGSTQKGTHNCFN